MKRKLPMSSVLHECRIPKRFDGIPTDVKEIEEIYAQVDRRCYDVPRGGSSIGHVNISAWHHILYIKYQI